MKLSSLRKFRRTSAYHEAGHAVVCLALGRTFEWIRLCEEQVHYPSALPNGQTAIRGGQFWPTDELLHTVQDTANEICLLEAGVYAQHRLTPHETLLGLVLQYGDTDMSLIRYWTDYALPGASREEKDEFNRQQERRARKLVKENWASITLVAEALLKRSRLTSEEVRELLAMENGSASPLNPYPVSDNSFFPATETTLPTRG